MKCPLCLKALPSDVELLLRPFCSKICKNKDLLNWIDARYTIPGAWIEEEEWDQESEDPSSTVSTTLS